MGKERIEYKREWIIANSQPYYYNRMEEWKKKERKQERDVQRTYTHGLYATT